MEGAMPVALITGGSRGLGLALTRALAARGWDVIVDARNRAALHGAAAELGPRVHAVAGDVADPRHRAELAAAVERLGRLDALVNNASLLGPSPLPRLRNHSIRELERLYHANAIAPLALAQRLLPTLEASSGAIVNVTSDAADEPYPGWGGYGSSKAALDRLTSVLAVEEPGVGVYAFDPGDMRTAMHQAAFPGEDISDRPEPETVVPALLRLVEWRPPSGRYRAVDLLVGAESPS
jgi:NAD(P)-dependent dehydrogenase (short-subunit alcohol dehydrogenase family)